MVDAVAESSVHSVVANGDANTNNSTMNTNDIKRTPVTISVNGHVKHVQQLDLALPFFRKPPNLGWTDIDAFYSHPYTIHLEREVSLSTEAFDAFTANFFAHQSWLEDQGGDDDICMVCVQVSAPDRPVLFVDSAGFGYARHVARLGLILPP